MKFDYVGNLYEMGIFLIPMKLDFLNYDFQLLNLIGYAERDWRDHWVDIDGNFAGHYNWGTNERGMAVPDNVRRGDRRKGEPYQYQDCAYLLRWLQNSAFIQ